ncbi:MAG: hypothetical protein QGF09_10415 [Rhodospirillales bacterium]|nr:hypothetical protein [Rhodospirillales bacterium]
MAERHLEEFLADRPELSRHGIGLVEQIGALRLGLLKFWSALECGALPDRVREAPRETILTMRAMHDRFRPD